MSSFKGKYWAPSYTEQMADNGFYVEQYKAPGFKELTCQGEKIRQVYKKG